MLVQETDSRCTFSVNEIQCVFDNWPAKYREKIQQKFIINEAFTTSKINFKKSMIQVSADAENILTNFQFTLEKLHKDFHKSRIFLCSQNYFSIYLAWNFRFFIPWTFCGTTTESAFCRTGFLRGLFLFLMLHRNCSCIYLGFAARSFFRDA